MNPKPMKIFIILMTYGSPRTLAEVPEYLRNVYGGKDASPEVIKEFQRRYKLIGGSPLIKITQEQAAALEEELNKQKTGNTFQVAAGMRFSHPFIEEVITQQAEDADAIIGIIMSPQFSPIIMKGYLTELEDAVSKLTRKPLMFKTATDWHLEPYFLQALAQRVQEALDTFPTEVRYDVPVLFSAHSMPKRVIDKEPDYITDLKETAKEVATLAGLKKKRWQFCYQSAGHTPEEWLKPDFADIMPELKKNGKKYVLIAPVQFLSDHLEILYDVGIGARKQAEEQGIECKRTESLNTSPLFIKALAEVVKKTI
jgi:protoporphyrin/coproporphyrin ferrochelatase